MDAAPRNPPERDARLGQLIATATLPVIGIALAMHARRLPQGGASLRVGGAAVAACGAILLAIA